MSPISYCWTKKKLAVKFSSFLFLCCQTSSLLCPAHLHSSLERALQVGQEPRVSRASSSPKELQPHFPLLLLLVMRPGPPLCLLSGAQICAPPLLQRPQRKGQQRLCAEQLVFHMLTLWITHLASKNCIIVFFPNPFRNLVVVTSEAVFSSFLI